MNLQPCDIASFYTAEEIRNKITTIDTAIDAARESMRDSLGDTQANQTVQRQSIDKLNQEKAVYIKAYNLVAGSDCAYATLTAAKYNPAVPRT